MLAVLILVVGRYLWGCFVPLVFVPRLPPKNGDLTVPINGQNFPIYINLILVIGVAEEQRRQLRIYIYISTIDNLFKVVKPNRQVIFTLILSVYRGLI